MPILWRPSPDPPPSPYPAPRLDGAGRYSEEAARDVMQKLLSAVSYLHANDIIHRDLKVERKALAVLDPLSRPCVQALAASTSTAPVLSLG
jgi:hypothetical protein